LASFAFFPDASPIGVQKVPPRKANAMSYEDEKCVVCGDPATTECARCGVPLCSACANQCPECLEDYCDECFDLDVNLCIDCIQRKIDEDVEVIDDRG